MRGVAFVAFVAVLASSACSLFTDLGGFDGDGETTTVPALDAAASETSSGGNGTDANGPSDADAGTSSDAPTESGPCSATFCDDFNTPPFGGAWTGKVESGGTVVADSNALLAKIGASGSDALRRAFLYKRFDAPKTVSCTFVVTAVDLSAGAEVLSFTLNAPGYKSYSLWLALHAAQTELGVAAETDDGGTVYDTRGVKLVEVGKPTLITMSTNFSTLSLSEDGAVVKDEGFFPVVTPVHVDVQTGITFHFSMASSAVRIDDVRCTVAK